MLLPRFEEEVEGKEVGEGFEFTLSPEEGYGLYSSDYFFELPLSSFAVDGQVREDLLVVGRVIPMMSDDGNVLQGTVKEVKDDVVVMDFNHPMAGKTLHFTGTVVSVREATEEELTHGLAHKCHCHKGEGEGCCHGEGEGCCHSEGESCGEGCCHGDCDSEGESCGEGCCHGEE